MSRDELIVVVRRQAGQIAKLMETNEELAGKLARLEHLLSRNSGNSSSPPSKDDDPGKPAPPKKNKRDKGGPQRVRGKQPGAPGTHLAWTENPDDRRDRFPQGRCDCGDDLGNARDLGIMDRYQRHCCIERSAHSSLSHLPAQKPLSWPRMPGLSWFSTGIVEPASLF